MNGVPVMLCVRGKRCLIVGGGSVAVRRCKALVEAGAQVVVVAPEISPELLNLPVEICTREFTPDDMAGCFLIVVATNHEDVNTAVSIAAPPGALVNRADAPEASHLHFMAQAQRGPVTLAVHTDNVSAAAAAQIRDGLAASLDPDWPRLLEAAAPCRARIRNTALPPAARQAALRRLTDAHAMAILKERGPEALREHLERLVAAASTDTNSR